MCLFVAKTERKNYAKTMRLKIVIKIEKRNKEKKYEQEGCCQLMMMLLLNVMI